MLKLILLIVGAVLGLIFLVYFILAAGMLLIMRRERKAYDTGAFPLQEGKPQAFHGWH